MRVRSETSTRAIFWGVSVAYKVTRKFTDLFTGETVKITEQVGEIPTHTNKLTKIRKWRNKNLENNYYT